MGFAERVHEAFSSVVPCSPCGREEHCDQPHVGQRAPWQGQLSSPHVHSYCPASTAKERKMSMCANSFNSPHTRILQHPLQQLLVLLGSACPDSGFRHGFVISRFLLIDFGNGT